VCVDECEDRITHTLLCTRSECIYLQKISLVGKQFRYSVTQYIKRCHFFFFFFFFCKLSWILSPYERFLAVYTVWSTYSILATNRSRYAHASGGSFVSYPGLHFPKKCNPSLTYKKIKLQFYCSPNAACYSCVYKEDIFGNSPKSVSGNICSIRLEWLLHQFALWSYPWSLRHDETCAQIFVVCCTC